MRPVPKSINEKIVRGFLAQEISAQEAIIDKVPVFGKRYCDAVDKIEDLEDVMEALSETPRRVR